MNWYKKAQQQQQVQPATTQQPAQQPKPQQQNWSLSQYLQSMGFQVQVNGNTILVNGHKFEFSNNKIVLDGAYSRPTTDIAALQQWINDPKILQYLKSNPNQNVQQGQPNPQVAEMIKKINTPNGDKLKLIFKTAQGSVYIMTEGGMTRRNKSFHANTGGADSGVHGWNQHIIFFHPQYYVMADAHRILEEAMSPKPRWNAIVGNGKFSFTILDTKSNQWRPATCNDVYPKSVAAGRFAPNQPIEFQYVKVPTVGYNVFEFDANGNQIKGIHLGNEVSDVRPITNAIPQELQPFVDAK